MMLCLLTVLTASAGIQKSGGWFEAAYMTIDKVAGATNYEGYYRLYGTSAWTKADKELVRLYPDYVRFDMVGLKAGNYDLKIVPNSGSEVVASNLTVVAHDRNGFAHYNRTEGVGGYKNDGTPKDPNRIIYVTGNNAKTVECNIMVDKTDTKKVGLQAILAALEKGTETRPLIIRIVGTVKKEDLDAIGSSAEGLQIKGKSGTTPMNLTIEGIGDDATIHGFGFLIRNCNSLEVRNFASMICMDDCMSLDTDNHYVWIHNMDFFYGGTGGAADQAKGDGTVDIKGKSSHVTVSYNHFFDSGKCSLGGMKSEDTSCWMTYHHNWFDHSDSRHPRIRTAFYHCYNNYYDGVSKYGVGVTSGGSSFVESNYFRNTKYPMLASKQGTDAEGDGTFSGEPGGVNKAYNNKIINPKKIQYWSAEADAEGAWDAVLVETRDAAVSAKAYSGGTSYNSTADAEAQKAVPASAIDPVDDVALICRGEMAGREGLGAGRMNGGDFKWAFYYPAQDTNYGVIAELKTALLNYKSTLVGFADGTTIKNGGATATVDGGDGKGKTQAFDDSTVKPSYAGGDIADDEYPPYIIGIDNDFYWFNESNDTQTKKYNTDGIITWDAASSYGKDKVATGTDFTGEYTGAIAVAKTSGYATFYCEEGITAIALKVVRAGSASGDVLVSNDGKSFSKVSSYEFKKKGTNTITASIEEFKYVKVTNTSGGTLMIHGVKVFKTGEVEPDERQDCDLTAVTKTKSINTNETYTLVQGTDFTTTSTGAVSFSSNKTTVATVNASGVITGVAEGTATITISQAGTETIKPATATVTVTVVDPRAASSLAVTPAEISIKEGEESQLTVTGAAGTVTYTSSKSSVATVDATGKVKAVAAGTAVITVTDPGSTTVKAATKTVNVTVTKDMTGTEICYFTASSKSPSNSMVSVTGNYSTDKGSLSYNNVTYPDCVKMESSTAISITPNSGCKVTLIFGGTTAAGGKKIKLDGTSITLDANGQYSFNATAGTKYELTKGDGINLFLVVFEPQTGINGVAETKATKKVVKYINAKGQIVIGNVGIDAKQF